MGNRGSTPNIVHESGGGASRSSIGQGTDWWKRGELESASERERGTDAKGKRWNLCMLRARVSTLLLLTMEVESPSNGSRLRSPFGRVVPRGWAFKVPNFRSIKKLFVEKKKKKKRRNESRCALIAAVNWTHNGSH